MDHLYQFDLAAFGLEPFSPVDNLIEGVLVVVPIVAAFSLLLWLPQHLLRRYEEKHGPLNTRWVDLVFSEEKSTFALLVASPLIMIVTFWAGEELLGDLRGAPPSTDREISELPVFIRGIYMIFGYYGVAALLWCGHVGAVVGWFAVAKRRYERWVMRRALRSALRARWEYVPSRVNTGGATSRVQGPK